MMKKFVLLVLLAAATGCGKLQEDPFKGFSKDINNGRAPSGRPTATEAVSRDLLRLDANETMTFKEGRADEYDFSARVLAPHYSTRIIFSNLSALPGATFDETTGKLKWTPPVGFVSPGTEGQTRELTLQVEVQGNPQFPDDYALSVRYAINVKVVREAIAPEIKRKGALPAFLREGSSFSVNVIVRDPDADNNHMPRLNVLNPLNTLNLATYTKISGPTAVFNSADEYQFTLEFDLSDAEITSSGVSAGLRFEAVSYLGKASAPEQISFKVYTRISNSMSSWITPVEFQPSIPKTQSFQIFDPRSEAILRISSYVLPDGGNLTCQEVAASRFLLNCEFQWTPPSTSAVGSAAAVVVNVEARNTDLSDSYRVNTRFTLPIKIAAPPSVPPAPTPAPVPLVKTVSNGGL